MCRALAKPGPSNASNVEVADTLNAQVECDLLFIRRYIILHMIDRCTRWHAAKLIPDKFETPLAKAIDELKSAATSPEDVERLKALGYL